MKFFNQIIYKLFYIIIIIGRSDQASYQEDMTMVDLSHSIIYSSPLKTGYNTTELLVPDFTKPPNCIVSLPLSPSWLLIDFGYTISGISQIRLFTDNFNENSHENLADIEVDFAEYLPLSIIQSFNVSEQIYFTRCGSTGAVSKYTSNAVVDCTFSSNVRWVLLKRQGQINLCFIQILQNAVKPECFKRILPQHQLYKEAKTNLSVFRSKKYVTFLKCLQNCDIEFYCNAIAFMPLSYGTGICQLLRFKESPGDFLCDDSCHLIINYCHVGERTQMRIAHDSEIIKIPQMKNNTFLVSVEINGLVSCNQDDCEVKTIFVKDNIGKIHHCGSINPNRLRVLSNVVFICENPVRASEELILRSNTSNQLGLFYFQSIHIRFVEKDSFPFSIINNFHSSKITTVSSTTPHFSKRPFKYSQIKKSTSTTITLANSQNTETKNIPSKYLLKDNNNNNNSQKEKVVINDESVMTKPQLIKHKLLGVTQIVFSTKKIKPSKINLEKKLTTLRIDLNTTMTNIYINRSITRMTKKFVTLPSKYTSFRSLIGNHSSTTFFVKQNSKKWLKNETDKRNPIEKPFARTTKHGLFSSEVFNNSNSIPSESKTTFSLKTLNSEGRIVPFIWIIALIFGAILVSVTAIVVLITFVEGHRKMKEWELPEGGFCPPDRSSGLLTMQSSLQMSTVKH